MKMPGSVVLAPDSATKRSLLGYGSGRSSTPLTTVKIAVAEPIPTANATTASSATPGAVFQEAQDWEKADHLAMTVAPSPTALNTAPRTSDLRRLPICYPVRYRGLSLTSESASA